MRIVVAHDSIATDGGVETYLLSVMNELRRRGHQLALAFCKGGRSPLSASADAVVNTSEMGLPAALDAIGAWRPDVCYSQNMGPLAVDRALIDKWPVVKMLHGFFGTCISGLKMHAWPAARACSRSFGPACLTLYVPRRCGQLSPGAMLRGYAWAREQRSLFTGYSSIVVASRFMGAEVAHHGVAANRINVLPLFSTMAATSGSSSSGEADTLLFAGRMTTLKGGHVLIAAAARAARKLGRPVRLVMAGEGPQKEAWRAQAASLNVPVDMTGWIAAEDRARVYSRGVVVAVPSLWPEPFGLVGLDAATLGRPAVAFDVGGIREWLTDGVNGTLVDAAAGEQGFADAITSMLDAPEACARMAQGARAAAARMTVAAHVDSLEHVLEAAG